MNNKWHLVQNQDGTIFSLKKEKNNILFRQDEYAGPAFFIQRTTGLKRVLLQEKGNDSGLYQATEDGIFFSLYCEESEAFKIHICVENQGYAPFTPERIFLRLGIDCYMEGYPQWDYVYFPTLLRCEKTHFWGYMQRTTGQKLAISCDTAIKSWKMNYNRTNEDHIGHRIYTVELDLINCFRQPERHPFSFETLRMGEKIERTICLWECDADETVSEYLFERTNLPFVNMEEYTIKQLCPFEAMLFSKTAFTVRVSKDGKVLQELSGEGKDTSQQIEFKPLRQIGLYTVTVETEDGKIAEAKIYCRPEWSWYLNKARTAALNVPQKASTHLESWVGFFSAFLARRYFPEPEVDNKLAEHFEQVLSLMYARKTAYPLTDPGRINNTAVAAGMLADAYTATGKMEYLELACGLCDYLISAQAEDGSYRAYANVDWLGVKRTVKEKGEHYTAVLYIAKSMLEVVLVEKKAAVIDEKWEIAAKRHYDSAARAIEELRINLDNINTEGEITFEDGMISCACLQLGLFAVLQTDESERRKYMDAAMYLNQKHHCLEQREIPDCRMRGGTLRFWEAQYDILADANMMNSPHGWTSWNVYATWYLYLLTGEKYYLTETMETIGSCMQVIDYTTGQLRWAFISDPCVQCTLWNEHPYEKGKGIRVPYTIGEQYVDMISGWWRVDNNKPVGAYLGKSLTTNDGICETDNIGGCCDNDVHEHFKAMAEVLIDKAYVYIREGQISSWNCTVSRYENKLYIYPDEKIVSHVHVNTDYIDELKVFFNDCEVQTKKAGMYWIGKNGIEDVCDVLL